MGRIRYMLNTMESYAESFVKSAVPRLERSCLEYGKCNTLCMVCPGSANRA